MLRALLSAQTRLADWGVPLSASALRVALTASACATLVARPPPLPRVVSLRTLSTGAAPVAPAAETRAVGAPIRAAALRVLSVAGVVDFVRNELKIERDDFEKLVKQKVDGATLLETSIDELCDRFGLSGGAAHTIMRAVGEASTVTLKVYPPLKAGGGRPVKVKLTPAVFDIKYVRSGSPLQLVSKDGAVLEDIVSLKDAAEASRHPTATLRWTRSFV